MATTTVRSDLVLFFDRLSRADIPFAGGKGANLGELTAAGLPVPGGTAERRLILDRARAQQA